MKRIQLAIYLALLVIAYMDEEQIPIIPAFWHYWSKFWYGLASFSGQAGINAEHRYHESMKVIYNG